MTEPTPLDTSVAVIGGGPAGLMAAETLALAGLNVSLFDAMPSVGRKFLLAGVGGMNITHSEPMQPFIERYREASDWAGEWLQWLDNQQLRAWIHGLGIDTFVGSSGRVFPTDMKAAPLLRAWLRRLRDAGVSIHTRHRWQGWNEQGALRFASPAGPLTITPRATVLALGGGSWARLGSDGAWVPTLKEQGVNIRDLLPANCGFEVGWSPYLAERFAGQPLKQVVASLPFASKAIERRGECIVTGSGLEGSLIYALSAELRDELLAQGEAILTLDLAPDRSLGQLTEALGQPRKGQSTASVLRKKAGLDPVKIALLHECLQRNMFEQPATLAAGIKSLPVTIKGIKPLDEAISTAGGIRRNALDGQLMLKELPGVFCAGEMLDWEAPTGGYLLTACFASGQHAARGAIDWLRRQA